MSFLNSIVRAIQGSIGQISVGNVKVEYLVLGFAVVAFALIIVTLEKPKALLWLLIIYAIAFVAIQFPAVFTWLKKTAPTLNGGYVRLAVGLIPVLTLGVLKFKKKRK